MGKDIKLIMKVDIVKGGEGSRGGKIIGHTRSGKPVYAEQNAKQEKTYNSRDHMDAMYVHDDVVGEKRKAGKGLSTDSDMRHHAQEADRHNQLHKNKRTYEILEEEHGKAVNRH